MNSIGFLKKKICKRVHVAIYVSALFLGLKMAVTFVIDTGLKNLMD